MLEIKKQGNILELIGHCDSEVECAKVSAICETLKIVDGVEILEYKTGYGKFKFKNINLLEKYKKLIDSLNFSLNFAQQLYYSLPVYSYNGESLILTYTLYTSKEYHISENGISESSGENVDGIIINSDMINGKFLGFSINPNSKQIDYSINSTFTGYHSGTKFYIVGSKDIGSLISYSTGLEYKGIKPENDKDSIIESLPSLTQDGLTFEGWYYDKSFSRKANIGDSITEDITLYAKWSHDTLPSLFTGVADTIRTIMGDEEKRIANYFPREIENINDIKEDIKQAISDKGVDMSNVNVFGDYAGKIGEITTGPEQCTLINSNVTYIQYIYNGEPKYSQDYEIVVDKNSYIYTTGAIGRHSQSGNIELISELNYNSSRAYCIFYIYGDAELRIMEATGG